MSAAGEGPNRRITGALIEARATARRRPLLTSWAVSVVALAAWMRSRPDAVWRYDAQNYFELSGEFRHVWSVGGFDDDLRGWAFPWLLRVAREVGSWIGAGDQWSVRLLMLAVAPVLLCVLVPLMAARLCERTHLTPLRILAVNLAFFVAWRNDLLVPLSDIPSLAVFTGGVLLVLRARHRALDVLAGGALAFAATARPAYLLGAGAAWLGLALLCTDRRILVRRAAAVAAGAALVLTPQIAVNVRHHHQFAVTPVRASDLTLFQLSQGLLLERYDTYIGDDPTVPPSLRFEEPRITAALGRYHIFPSLRDYAGYVASHPLASSRVFVRHLVNGMDTRFGGTYLSDLDDGDLVWPIVNAALVLSAVAVIGVRRARRGRTVWRSPTTYCMVVLAACCATSIAGAMEARFLMPLQVALFATLFLTVDRTSLPSSGRMRALVGATVVAAVALSFSITSSTMGHLVPFPMRADGSIVRPTP